MNTTFRYQLEKGSKKYLCPVCHKKRFVRYVDSMTDQYLSNTVGRCDREVNCGYHVKPNVDLSMIKPIQEPTPKIQAVSYLPAKMMQTTICNYSDNLFIQWLATLPGWNLETAIIQAKRYNVGTGSKAGVKGWPIFWQVDTKGRVRSGKLIKYDPATGKRVKDDSYSYDWIHTLLQRNNKLKDFELVQCLFGLHLITDNSKPIAIVESEKTAIVASLYLPQLIWLASGQLNGLNEYKLKPLAGRKIILFPDVGCFDKWNDKADEMAKLADISVSRLLESKAPNEHKGYDLADYLIQFDVSIFNKQPTPYPAEWDTIKPPEVGTTEYKEMIRAEIADSDTKRPDLVIELDNRIADIMNVFDAQPI